MGMWILDAAKPYLPFVPLLAVALSLIGFGWAIFIYNRDNRRSMVIRQIGSDVENVVLSFDDGLTTVIMLHLVVVNDSPKAMLVIAHYELKLLWNDPEFDWLMDPAEFAPPRQEYGYNDILKYPRDTVLNHRRYDQGKLAPGDAFKGLLMGKSMITIPENLKHGTHVEMKLVIHDTRGKRYSAPFEFRIDRMHG
jgi:hypothetical protein